MEMQRSKAGDDGIRASIESSGVTIFHGSSCANVERKTFQIVIYQLLKESTDIAKVGKNNGKYINAYEWMLANVYRIAGIQLYWSYVTLVLQTFNYEL